MILKLTFWAMITALLLIVIIIPEVWKDVTVWSHVPRVFFSGIRGKKAIQSVIQIAVDAGFNSFYLSYDCHLSLLSGH